MKRVKRIISFLLTLLLVTGLLPTGVRADVEHAFVLVAEAKGSLVIAPEYVTYTEGQTVRDALLASGHTFTGIEDDWILEIDGIEGNYVRGDEDGEFLLSKLASEVSFYRFSEAEESSITEGLQKLMTAMADYKLKSPDVQAAAKEAYDTACAQFVGISSESAAFLADALNAAMSAYEDTQNGEGKQVTFTDGTAAFAGADITMRNAYGKEWSDDGDGILEVPADTYTFRLHQDGLWAEGEITVADTMSVTLHLPQELWLDLDAFRLSGSYGADDNEENKFTDDEYALEEWNGRELTVAVGDTFTGRIYSYAKYRTDLLSEVPTMTALYQSAVTGETCEQAIPFESLTTGAGSVLKKGSVGNTIIYRVSSQEADGYTYSQDYTVHVTRVPSLTGITVKDQRGVDQTAMTAFDGNVTDYTYKVLDTVTEVTVQAVPLEAGYQVTINGQNAEQGVTVPVSEEEETLIPVTVEANGYTNTYTLHIRPGEGKTLSFVTERLDVTLEVVNSNGEVMPYEKFREGTNSNRYQYILVPGETYSYVATAGKYYHVADEFTMENVADSTISVDVPVEDWLDELSFGTKSSKSYKGSLPLDTTFASSDHAYTVQYVDTEHLAYIWVNADENMKIEALYDQKFASALYHNKPRTLELTAGATTGTQLNRFLMDENPIENVVTIRLSKEISGTSYYQDYEVQFTRSLTLRNISATCDGIVTSLVQTDEAETVGFDSDVKEYTVKVSMAANAMQLTFDRYNEKFCNGEEEVGYQVLVDDVDVTESDTAMIPLNGTMETQTVKVTVKNEKAPNGSSDYILHILKSPPVAATFTLTPQQALLSVYETMSGERLWPDENGDFQFCEGYSYHYNLTAFGYISKSGTLDVTRNEEKALVVMDGEDAYIVEDTEGSGGAVTIPWTLEAAPANDTIREDMVAEWPNFRGDDSNNCVTDVAMPTAAEEGTLYWANKIGQGYSSEAVGSPIVVDGDLVTYARDKIYRVDTISGEIKAVGTMDHKSAHATTPPSYANGMVFVALTDGTVQAFNADTLESLWIYKDPLGGQPVCPLTIKDGYLYTGFWNSEKGDANFVCLSVTDEDPTKSDEAKDVSWYYTSAGGYYWAGAYAGDEYVMVGTDDGAASGTSQTSRLLLFEAKTGKLLDSWSNLNGDVRSTIVYDNTTDAFYFTSKGGSFYSVKVVQTEEGWKLDHKWSVSLANGTDGTPMSTCSPCVYNGRAYVGVSGAAQFGAYSGHNITVIDLTKQAVAYRVATQGYPQTSGLLTTAYEEENGYVYVYFFDNMTPGKLRVLRDKAGQTSADYVTTEGSLETAYALFTPTGDQAQYAICSPIVDDYGTIYFKNDSAHLMAFGSKIEKIEVTQNPDKMVYAEGDAFNPEGMVVTATYANGKTRDITDYVEINDDPITADNTRITISFPYVMYHNQENGTAMDTGVNSTTPVTTLQVSIGDVEPSDPSGSTDVGDVNGDGEVDTIDANMIISYYYGNTELTEEQLIAANANGDEEVDTIDANMIISYYYGNIASLRISE